MLKTTTSTAQVEDAPTFAARSWNIKLLGLSRVIRAKSILWVLHGPKWVE
jgi:hypothetical protein